MATPLLSTRSIAGFRCTGPSCPDTCCSGWGMQLTAETLALYRNEAPELAEAVTEQDGQLLMRRDPQSGGCVKLREGWCGIQQDRGEGFLGDACHFFPRITRRLGPQHVMSASLACPEITRRVLTEDAPAAASDTTLDRLPFSLRDYLPEGMEASAAWNLHTQILEQARTAGQSAERSLTLLGSVARSLDTLPLAQWPDALPFYLRMAASHLPAPEPHIADPFRLLNALQGLVHASGSPPRPRLAASLRAMEEALAITLDWQTLALPPLGETQATAYLRVAAFWDHHLAAAYAPMLRRWLEAQLSVALFPFAGLGNTLAERITIIAVRFATLKLALMCEGFLRQGLPPEEETVRITQSIARFMDHLADPEFSLRIYAETGWVRLARARALVGDG